MKISGIHIQNFRGIQHVEMHDLGDLVVIAGQNGSGKSCILDAIRLVKSVYGPSQPNEYQQWFGEFQINFANDPLAVARLFNDPRRHLIMQVDFQLNEEEKKYLTDNAKHLISMSAWRAVLPEVSSWKNFDTVPLASQYRTSKPEVDKRIKEDSQLFRKEITKSTIRAKITLSSDGTSAFEPSKILELVFSNSQLGRIGIIDYHGAHRVYNREQLSSINVNLAALEEQRINSALYNYNIKYSNIKSEMAALYVREALAEKAGIKLSDGKSLTKTLQALFTTFFPDKEFLGPEPTADGSLRFLVKVAGVETHDLDDLSSGEKEVLYGYLRLRNSTPRCSVILLDEPELHLNPRLSRNLPEFYHKHLVEELGNQVWFITHSDAILRESLGREGVSVFHMTPPTIGKRLGNQAKVIHAKEHLELAILDLVGNLASYNPGAKVLIFEGEDSEFDLNMTLRLFPEIESKINPIAGTNKTRVRGLHLLLDKLQKEGRLPRMDVCSITDQDGDNITTASKTQYTWDCYHIENYLLVPSIIQHVIHGLKLGKPLWKADKIETELLACAREIIPSLVAHQLSSLANREVVSAINTRINPASTNAAIDLTAALKKSNDRILGLLQEQISLENLRKLEAKATRQYANDLKTGKWRKSFRGRDVLRRFAGRHVASIPYESFRNLIISRMRENEYQPPGMKRIIRQILEPS